MHTGAQRGYLGLMALLAAAYWLTPTGVARNAAELVFALAAAVAVAAGAWLDRSRRPAWSVFTLGVLAIAAGDAVALGYAWADRPLPFPSGADAGYLCSYLVISTGLALLQRGRPWDLAGLLDAAVMTVGGGVLLWVALSGPIEGGPDTTVLTELAYPVGNIVMLALLVWLVTSPVFVLEREVVIALALGLVATLVGDTVYALASTILTPQDRLFESAYLTMYAAFGYAGLRSGTSVLPGVSTTRPAASGLLSPVRLLAMYGSLLVIPAALLLTIVRDGGVQDLLALVIASTLLTLLVPTRMGIANRQLRISRDERDRFREDLQHQAAHDPLTNLPNRAYLLELLTGVMHRAARLGQEVAVLFVDLDYFKRVNDTLGHAAGDEALRVTAERMRATLRASDVLARQGGDEFVVVIDPVPPPADLVEIADRLVEAVSAPIMTGAGRALIGASVGIALARDGEIVPEQLLQSADLAAYRAKANGRGRVEMFDAALREELQARSDLEARIRAALAAGEFELHYQPVISLAAGQLHGYEALIRWRDPGRGLIPPNDFIPVAEESQLISEIGRWVLNRATRQLAEWVRTDPVGHAEVTVAVNISARHLASRSLVQEVRQALHESGLPARQLVLEITETVLLDEPAADLPLRELRALGVTISLDDFGTGYTSIGQLQKLQIDTLKIDQSFLRTTDPGTTALVHLMITAAHAFGLDVVAEGVETAEQLERLTAQGCELAQGYYLGRPVPPQDILVGSAAEIVPD
jgi:diguanylate cyclase (GGDEF)-like protein